MSIFSRETAKHRRLTKLDRRLADRIRWYRRNSNLTQEELSERLGMHGNYVSRLERYENGASLPVLYKLASIFGIKVRDLFDF
jgi:transcriptional regulator with XRE-family HTH domain